LEQVKNIEMLLNRVVILDSDHGHECQEKEKKMEGQKKTCFFFFQKRKVRILRKLRDK
jgi:membrane-anchored protein YejM (alkaline phosphatase superfamily)